MKERKIHARSGQAAIEFIAITVVIFFFLLFFLSLAVLIVTSEYMDYATFMAARTYKSMFQDRNFQEKHARDDVLTAYANKIQGVIHGQPDVKFINGDDNTFYNTGLQVTYSIDMFYLPPLFVSQSIPSRLTLTSEARLGRDPSHDDCTRYFDEFVKKFGLGLEGTTFVDQMDDNGC
jgi:hypothetical protein